MVKRYVAAMMAGNRRYTWYQPLPAVTIDAMGCQEAIAEKIIDKPKKIS